MTLLNAVAELWNAKYRAIDSSRTKYETRLANAPNKAQRDFWRRAVARTNAKLEAHVATWAQVEQLFEA
jgi:hypothetical protein